MRVYARQLYEHLPYLRRYARALTGATEAGDELVGRGVEVATMAPSSFGLSDGSRIPLYALLNLLFDEDGEGRPKPSAHPIERALARLEERDRRVYLLVALEDLTLVQAAQVMQMEPAEAHKALVRAREGVREAMVQRVLVVEDNPIQALEIADLIADMGHVLCGTAATEREAMRLLDDTEPTLALLDVRLADGGDGVAVARRLKQRRRLRTIFVTGLDDDRLPEEVRRLGPVIHKPFMAEAVRGAVTRAIFMPSPVAFA